MSAKEAIAKQIFSKCPITYGTVTEVATTLLAMKQECADCDGLGKRENRGSCPYCNGTGESDLPVIIPHPNVKIVCLCGSTRFEDTYTKVARELTLQGNIVLTAHVFREINRTPDINSALYKLHLAQIDLADEVFILNVGDYIGESTRSELEYAKAHSKTIRFLEEIQ